MATLYKNGREMQQGYATTAQVRTHLVDASIALAGAVVFGLGVISTQIGQIKRRVQRLQHSSVGTQHTAYRLLLRSTQMRSTSAPVGIGSVAKRNAMH